MDYLNLLEHSFELSKELGGIPPESRLAFLSESVFDFTTHDDEMGELFSRKAVEVCEAINTRTTFEYIEEGEENYGWYLLMCNMPFFADKLEWGSSIRGAWWGAIPTGQIEFQSCGLWDGDKQLSSPMKFSVEEWEMFIGAVIEFSRRD